MAHFLQQLGSITRTFRTQSSLPFNIIFGGRLCRFGLSTSWSPVDSASNNMSSQVYTLRDGPKCDWFDFPSDHHQLHQNLYNPSDFILYPYFITSQEQLSMIEYCLAQLDKVNSSRRRHRAGVNDSLIPGTFKLEEEYTFESGHFDEVISGYREMLLNQQKNTSNPTKIANPSVDLTLAKMQALMPSPTSRPLIHALHLSSQGKIDPHIDNLATSGPTIIGLSLGSTRVMRLGHKSTPIESHLKVLLPPGSVYVQRDSVRYNLQHSIPTHDVFQNQKFGGEQRLSLMLRDEPISDCQK